MEIDILIEEAGWGALGLPALAARACTAALQALALRPEEFEISLLACDDARIAALNAEFRGKPVPTNVLAWPTRAIDLPLGGLPPLPAAGDLGDIAIALGVCQAEAAAQAKPIADHVTHLLVHATLHLLGFDHQHPEDAAEMERLETQILAKLGISDPY